MDTSIPKRFCAIDALRGICAVIVVVWHFPGYFQQTPYYYGLYPFYTNGQVAVDVFFVISGFVLMHTYRDRVGTLASYRDFAVRRLARLYPLHILSLVALAFIFVGFKLRDGEYGYIYIHNDPFHFALNILMMQYVGFQDGWSFNGPSWTMSTEFWINLLFGAMLMTPRRVMVAASLITCAAATAFLVRVHGEWLSVSRVGNWLEPLFIRTAAGFFAGVVTYEVWRRRRGSPTWFFVGAVGILALMGISRSNPYNVYIEALIAIIASPLMIYGAASFPSLERAAGRRWGVWLGDVSFSMYMWHFPIAAIIVVMGAKAIPAAIVMPAYFATVFVTSSLSGRLLEFPAQRQINAIARGHRPAALVVS